MQGRRVVVTGLGLISPVGNTVAQAWESLLAGKSGIRGIDTFDVSAFATHFAGTIVDFDPQAYDLSSKDTKKMDLFIQYSLAAATQAVEDAGLTDIAEAMALRAGVCIGSGIGGLSTIEKNDHALLGNGPKRISPFFIPSAIVNMSAGHAAMRHGFKGPNLAISTACTTGAHSIGIAARTISYGDADIMLAGGGEYASTPLGVGGFAAARALSTRNDSPEEASRPWDVDRDGFVLGDGAGVIVLESYESAVARGATIYAELAGFGMSADAFHITQPSVEGPATSMRNAMQDAGINADQVGYVNAHGTSTPIGDKNESQAIKEAFGAAAQQVAISSTKSMTGHLLGAAGALEAIITILTLRDQILPPTINLHNVDPECDLDYIPLKAREKAIEYAMSNSFGFGGTNGSLVFKKV